MEIKFLNEAIKELGFKPSTEFAAGYDLRAAIEEPLIIQDGETHRISTGISIHMGGAFFDHNREGTVLPCAVIMPRSGLGCRGIKPGNTPGLIDADYQGEILICLENLSGGPIQINPMDRIAQLVFMFAIHPMFKQVDTFSLDSDRGENGFGSTGLQ